jgi:hypothetical protein
MNNRNLLLLLAGVGACVVVLANIMLTETAEAVSVSKNPPVVAEYLNNTLSAATGDIQKSQEIYHDTTSTVSMVYKLLLKR